MLKTTKFLKNEKRCMSDKKISCICTTHTFDKKNCGGSVVLNINCDECNIHCGHCFLLAYTVKYRVDVDI